MATGRASEQLAMHDPVLHGEKVVLRRFGIADLDATYIGWLNDPLVVRYSNQRFRHHDRDSCRRYLDSFTGSDNLFMSIRRRDNDTAVGTMTAYVSVPHGTVDVGIMVGDRSVWGQGYGQDAWDVFTTWLLTQPHLRKLTAGTLAGNAGMIRLMERSGMALEAVRKAQELVDGQPMDILYYAKFRNA